MAASKMAEVTRRLKQAAGHKPAPEPESRASPAGKQLPAPSRVGKKHIGLYLDHQASEHRNQGGGCAIKGTHSQFSSLWGSEPVLNETSEQDHLGNLLDEEP
jgi:hypothetical protein